MQMISLRIGIWRCPTYAKLMGNMSVCSWGVMENLPARKKRSVDSFIDTRARRILL